MALLKQHQAVFDEIKSEYIHAAGIDSGTRDKRIKDIDKITEKILSDSCCKSLPDVIYEIGSTLRREKQAFINRMRVFAGICEKKGVKGLAESDFMFPSPKVNVDKKISRIRYMETRLYLLDEYQIGDSVIRFSNELWTQESTIRDDMTMLRSRQGQLGQRNVKVTTTENEIVLTINKTELWEIVEALVEYADRNVNAISIIRIIKSVWRQIDKHAKTIIDKVIRTELKPSLERMLKADQPSLPENRKSPHEPQEIERLFVENGDSWFVLKKRGGFEHLIAGMYKCGFFYRKKFSIDYMDDAGTTRTYIGEIKNIDLLERTLVVDSSEGECKIRAEHIYLIKYKEID